MLSCYFIRLTIPQKRSWDKNPNDQNADWVRRFVLTKFVRTYPGIGTCNPTNVGKLFTTKLNNYFESKKFLTTADCKSTLRGWLGSLAYVACLTFLCLSLNLFINTDRFTIFYYLLGTWYNRRYKQNVVSTAFSSLWAAR